MKIVNIQALERKNKHSCLKEFDFKQEIELHKKIVIFLFIQLIINFSLES